MYFSLSYIIVYAFSPIKDNNIKEKKLFWYDSSECTNSIKSIDKMDITVNILTKADGIL